MCGEGAAPILLLQPARSKSNLMIVLFDWELLFASFLCL